jgi:hypothetical protein
MSLLTKIDKTNALADSDRQLDIKVDVGRTLALMVVGVVVLAISAALYFNDRSGPAALFFALGEAIVVGGFGISVGEKSGAKTAEDKLT